MPGKPNSRPSCGVEIVRLLRRSGRPANEGAAGLSRTIIAVGGDHTNRMPFGDHGEVHMRPRLASSLLIALFLLAGCASSTSVRSSGSENGSRSQMIFGLPF